ncbi:sterol desaturase family protein [Fimbriiglobus ruber]|uniref:High-affnity carbon uptake protein Hat/HatR n=1 Tax=Fimbriiglobus ruber TaxID=1908690 RepID=A0A225DTK2_9BACT|nr:sterol desaturase family protein [Fimbriiglobus ruber]OWK39447.1 High-affnity carbon uptake protein Hat/HatR [Fimbriiglobus ruber]
MHWISTLGDIWLATLVWLLGLGTVFAVLTRVFPCNPGMFWWKDRRAVRADVVYWFGMPLFFLVSRMLMLMGGVLLLFGGEDPPPAPVIGWPLALQAVAILLIQDVMLYWIHRLFHSRTGWKFHAIHHSPETLDWTASARFHPLNHILEFALVDVAVMLLGFPPAALFALAPLNTIYSAMVHANLNWTFGPLRYVFASPVFHRWHHTTEMEGRDKNFASTFPFLDLIFGTFYMPAGKRPEVYGTSESDVPGSFVGQFVYPVRNTRLAGWVGRRPVVGYAAGILGIGVLLSGLAYCDALTVAWNEQQAQLAMADAQPDPNEWPVAIANEDLRKAGGPIPIPEIPLLAPPAIAVTSVAVSADGRSILSGHEDGSIKLWDGDGREKRSFPAHRLRVTGVAMTKDGSQLISAGADGIVKVWDADGHEKRTLWGHNGAVLSVAVTSDGRKIVSGGVDGSIKVWVAEGNDEQTEMKQAGAVTSIAIDDAGNGMIATGDVTQADAKGASRWDLRSQKAAYFQGHRDLVYATAVCPDGHLAATGGFDGQVKLWDTQTQKEVRSLAHAGRVYCVAFSGDGRLLASGGNDRTVRVWDVATGQEVASLTSHTDAITGVAVTADGSRVVSCSRDGTIRTHTLSVPTSSSLPAKRLVAVPAQR